MTKRKFYKSRVVVEMLSEEPLRNNSFESLLEVHHEITEGHCSGQWHFVVLNEVLDGADAAKALTMQFSDPEFFRLTCDGDDTEG